MNATARRTLVVLRAVVFCALGAACAEDAVLPDEDAGDASFAEGGADTRDDAVAEGGRFEAAAECLHQGAACADAALCCSEWCADGACAPQPFCGLVGDKCTLSSECCQASCDPEAGVCVEPPGGPCKLPGIACASKIECCSLSCGLPGDGGTSLECLPQDAAADGG